MTPPPIPLPLSPRVVPWVTVKRTNTRLGRGYGHWWVELDGTQSYGWWPGRCPVRLGDVVFGTTGTLNGVGGSCPDGTERIDPHHGGKADYSFHPYLVLAKTDEQLRADITGFARGYSGGWRWSVKGPHCRSFQLELLRAVGLAEGPEHLHTYGPGCPFLYPRAASDGPCSTPSRARFPSSTNYDGR